MGGIVGKQKDVYTAIYDKGIGDALRVQRSALKLSAEGKLNAFSPLPVSFSPPPSPPISPTVSPPHTNRTARSSSLDEEAARGRTLPGAAAQFATAAEGGMVAPAPVPLFSRVGEHRCNHDSAKSAALPLQLQHANASSAGGVAIGNYSGQQAWGPQPLPSSRCTEPGCTAARAATSPAPPAYPPPSPAVPPAPVSAHAPSFFIPRASKLSAESFARIRCFVEGAYSERDRSDARTHALKLWERYHRVLPVAGGHSNSMFTPNASQSGKSVNSGVWKSNLSGFGKSNLSGLNKSNLSGLGRSNISGIGPAISGPGDSYVNSTTSLGFAPSAESNRYLRPEELLELTRDSLMALQAHLAPLINSVFEEVRKGLVQGMQELLRQNAPLIKAQQAAGAQYKASQKDGAPSFLSQAASSTVPLPSTSYDARRDSISLTGNPGYSGSSTAPRVRSSSTAVQPIQTASNIAFPPPSVPASLSVTAEDLSWLDSRLESEKQLLLLLLSTQVSEWLDHCADVSDAIGRRLDPLGQGIVTRRLFADRFPAAINEIVGPHFFSKHIVVPPPQAAPQMEA